MRRCSLCAIEKQPEDFNRCAASADGLQAYCRSCQRDYHRSHRDRINPLIHRRTRERREVLAVFVLELLRASACADCDERDPVVLEFDHVRGQKSADVSKLVADGVSERRLRDEIAKCEIVCANCHRRRTASRALTRRWVLSQRVGRPGFEPGTTTA